MTMKMSFGNWGKKKEAIHHCTHALPPTTNLGLQKKLRIKVESLLPETYAKQSFEKK